MLKYLKRRFKGKKNIVKIEIEEELEDNTCIICFDDVSSEKRTLTCNHSYHKKCINEWIKTKNSCPICRCVIPLNKKQKIRKFFKTTYKITKHLISGVVAVIFVPFIIIFIILYFVCTYNPNNNGEFSEHVYRNDFDYYD